MDRERGGAVEQCSGRRSHGKALMHADVTGQEMPGAMSTDSRRLSMPPIGDRDLDGPVDRLAQLP